MTRGAIGNLLNRYRAVLRKCHLMNVLGALAVTGTLVLGGTGVAGAESIDTPSSGDVVIWNTAQFYSSDTTINGKLTLNTDGKASPVVLILSGKVFSVRDGIEINDSQYKTGGITVNSPEINITSGDGKTTGTVLKDYGRFLLNSGNHKGFIILDGMQSRLSIGASGYTHT